MLNRAWMTIDYDEGDQSTYKAVTVKIRDGKEVRFSTGDPVADWKSALRHAADESVDMVLFSSSVDHFVMDGDGFQWGSIEGLDILEKADGAVSEV